VRGFEVYEDEAALAEVHRSSAPYKAMRESVGTNELLQKPTDLRFLQPTGVGFMCRESPTGASLLFQDVLPHILRNSDGKLPGEHYVVVYEMQPLSKAEKDQAVEIVREIADKIISEAKTAWLSFWLLEYKPEYGDEGLKLFTMFRDKESFEKEQHIFTDIQRKTKSLTSSARTTTWLQSGIGFIGR
jgi:hypothetical protein